MQDLDQFNIACEQLLNGKYVLIEVKLSSLLKIFDENEKLKILVSNALNKYNFSSAFEDEINTNLVLPQDEYEVISFVYTLLYKAKNNELNFGEAGSGNLIQIVNKILPSFQSAINNMYSKNYQQIEAEEYRNNIFNNLKSTITLILDNLDKYKFTTTNKEEFLMLINSLFQACEKNDKKLVYSLMIGLDYFTLANKKLRSIYLTLEECFSN